MIGKHGKDRISDQNDAICLNPQQSYTLSSAADYSYYL